MAPRVSTVLTLALLVILMLHLLHIPPWYTQETSISEDVQTDETTPARERVVHNHEMKHLREKGRARDISDLNVNELSDEEVLLTLHSLLDNIDTVCERKLRMGNLEDKGWEVCDDEDVAPTPPGLVYAFGVDTDFQFERDISSVYGVEVHSFDPSKKSTDYDVTKKIHYHNMGIDNMELITPKGFKMYRFENLRKILGHQDARIDVMMMNSEHAEWASLADMLETGSFPQLKQLFVEYHLDAKRPDIRRKWLKTVQAIESRGYKKFYVHKNFHCQMNITGFPTMRTRCYDVHYLYRP